MITAAVAPVIASSNHEAAWATVLALLTVFAICAVLYQHERRADRHETVTNEHDAQLGLLAGRIQALAEWLGVEVTDPVEDDSPEAMEASYPYASEDVEQVSGSKPSLPDDADDTPTLPDMPALPGPATEPSGIPLAVQSALIEQWPPSPVPRKSADWVEAELAKVRARIDAAREAS